MSLNGNVTAEKMAESGLKPPSQAGGAHMGGGQGGGQFGKQGICLAPDIIGGPNGPGRMGPAGPGPNIAGLPTGTFNGGHMPVGPH